jgi:hypothetical protein
MAALREDIVHLQVAVDQSILADSISRYSSRLARGEFIVRGYNVTHAAVAKLFKKLSAECGA